MGREDGCSGDEMDRRLATRSGTSPRAIQPHKAVGHDEVRETFHCSDEAAQWLISSPVASIATLRRWHGSWARY